MKTEDFTPASYNIRVNGAIYAFTNPEPSAHEILQRSGKDSNSYVLIFAAPGEEQRALNTEDNVDLRQPGIEEFTFASTARQFIAYVDETQVVFHKPDPTGAELLQAIGKNSDNYALTQILAHVDDQFVEPDEKVDLRQPGIEKFTTVSLKDLTIIVNGRPKIEKRKSLSFAQIVALAFDNPPTGTNIAFTISFRKGCGAKPEGTLIPGETIPIQGGMIFNVTATDKS